METAEINRLTSLRSQRRSSNTSATKHSVDIDEIPSSTRSIQKLRKRDFRYYFTVPFQYETSSPILLLLSLSQWRVIPKLQYFLSIELSGIIALFRFLFFLAREEGETSSKLRKKKVGQVMEKAKRFVLLRGLWLLQSSVRWFWKFFISSISPSFMTVYPFRPNIFFSFPWFLSL